jgi:hypothetical protein
MVTLAADLHVLEVLFENMWTSDRGAKAAENCQAGLN